MGGLLGLAPWSKPRGMGREPQGSKLNFHKRTLGFPSGWPEELKGIHYVPSCLPKPRGKEEHAGSGDSTRLQINVTPDTRITVRLAPAQQRGGGSDPRWQPSLSSGPRLLLTCLRW